MVALELTNEEAELLIKAIDKLSWSYVHIGMAGVNPKRVALAALRARIVAAVPIPTTHDRPGVTG